MDSLFGALSGFSVLTSTVLYAMHQDWRFGMASAVVFSLWSIRISFAKQKGLEAK
jgi:hypothetical protein